MYTEGFVVHLVLNAGFLLILIFVPDNGDDIFLQNVVWISPDYISHRIKVLILCAS
jgi:hypothetical protein